MFTEADASVWAAAIAGVASTISAFFAFKANKNAKESNDAVNHRHLQGTPRLYDIVLELQGWMQQWRDLPLHLNNGHKLGEKIDDLQVQISILDRRVKDHVHWEESVKYHEQHPAHKPLEGPNHG